MQLYSEDFHPVKFNAISPGGNKRMSGCRLRQEHAESSHSTLGPSFLCYSKTVLGKRLQVYLLT